ncbi:histone-lysine N-methyltransferase, H3 lysine-9 specific SUVH6 [Beta vulgaris subsp. vulgaris]|uniref:histone-lysine N-methyltransferase, H3 lysine-9 specific SUVH6 n=1 Tax=Beta vulgaris subsp. vulgaris TaxID=3555 RepID=UPI00203745DA|nr:histone-lysine N-methyltransferase, H3 lysine-9 specific SUVH6 [Beta vulgaris subsp. vulgaris]XP_048500872.1 histone-lysine N-methyltransferase, H3 lysine-9 specific SUVH6 [Beta vulgaris subsp. vulgaris]
MEVENHGIKNPKVVFSRDFPPDCGISNSSFKGFSAKKSFHHYTRDFPTGCGPNALKITQIFTEKLSRSGKDSDSLTWRRYVTAMKSKVGNEVVTRNPQTLKGKELVFNNNYDEKRLGEKKKVVEIKQTQKLKVKEPVLSNSKEREKVLEMLALFRKRLDEISQSGRGIRRVDTTAYGELKNEGKIMNRSALMIGSVPGVEVGDKFHYRIELLLVGLHKQTQGGIDSMEWRGSRLATCIVANERHLDKMNDPNALTYIGEGGVLKRHEVGVPPDQELKGGNLALSNSMKEKRPVRVVRGLSSEKSYGQRVLYVYDGLYEVRDCEKKKGPQGNMIYQFHLIRCTGQPAVPWLDCRRYRF